MRNLAVVDYLHYNEVFPSLHLNPPCFTVDSDSESCFCATQDGVVTLDIRTGTVTQELDLRSKGHLMAEDHVVDLHYRLDDMTLCIALSNGDILSWSAADDEVECVGCIGEGISAMRWSPDGELLAIYSQPSDDSPSRIYLIVCHGSELQPLCDFPFSSSEFGEAEFVTVGWGKKETQFHGSEGKQAATKKETIELKVKDTDDGRPRIRWIGDGRFFVVSATDSREGSRKLRVWTREGVLHSTSEPVTGLEHCLDWRPSGNLIVSSQTHNNRHDIIFFERNGLRHGQFTLPYPVDTVKVNELFWNSESNILCIWLEEISTRTAYVQCWTMNNYHWYLKLNFEFSSDSGLPVHIMWDVLDASVLYVLCSHGSLRKYQVDWVTVDNTCTRSDHEVSVIDGSKLYVTPFRAMTVPPPMCAYSLNLPSSVQSVAFCQTSNEMAILLASGQVLLCALANSDGINDKVNEKVKLEAAGGNGFSVKCSPPANISTYTLPDSLKERQGSLRHFCWLSKEEFCVVCTDNTGRDTLALLELEPLTMTLNCRQEVAVGRVKTICTDGGRLILEYEDGSVWLYQNSDLSVFTLPSGRPLVFPVLCCHIQLCTFAGQEALVGMSQKYRLFVNEHEIANNCTSFAVHNDFLLMTSHSHTIRCINRKTPVQELASLSDGKTHIFDETVRRVERGSKIVTCISDGTKVVLQMPRGNLEVIHPRALVLSTVRKLLDRLNYKEAFLLMHRHRIKMNLICDHNRQQFLDNISTFIEQLESVTRLSQFISDLCEEDVTCTMYTAFYDQKVNSENTSSRSKVDTVCDAMISALRSIDFDKYLLSILTAHACKTVPELETALNLIKSLQDKAQLEESLKYLMYLVDVNELYDVALGMYDFELVLMVAERSQKDPKEYLPFLNRVKQLDEDYQKYTIDLHLKRYGKALKHICKCVPKRFQEAISLIKEHCLYREALEILPSKSQERQEVLLAFADFLNEKRRYEEAAILYAQSDQHRQAVDCCVESGSWQQAVISLEKLSLSRPAYLKYISKLSDKLETKRMYGDAAILLELYAGQPEEAITTLISGSLWAESLRLIEKYSRHDFLETDWKPAVEERYQQILSSVQSDLAELKTRKDRFLAVLQVNKSKAELIGEEYRDVHSDMYSDTSSMTGMSAVSSTHTRSTGRTSKNQRKAQRKKWSLKEGSKFEDLALLDEMKKLVARIDSMRDEVRGLLLALVRMEQLEKASQLQSEFSDALSFVITLVPDVWSAEVVNSSAQFTGEHSTVNSILESMAKLNAQTSANPAATSAEIEVKRAPVVSSDSTWRLSMLSKLN